MLPHITNSVAGVNRQDPVHKSLFEVYFTLPEAIKGEFSQDEALLTQQVLKITGLGSLDKGPSAGEQKFMGTSRSYLQPKLDSTFHEFTVSFTLNLRNRTDNWVYKVFKAWNKLCYDLSTGETVIKPDYLADWFKISIGNRAGEIYREILFKDVMMVEGITGGNDDLDYENKDHVDIDIKFRSDWADDIDV